MIFASNNLGKLNEIRSILKDYDIKSLKDINLDIDILEDGETFYDNALKKAIEIYNITKEEVIADDSGLCIDCLNNFPGVMTHRFLGDDATDQQRNKYLINEVNKFKDRKASVVCSLVYYDGANIIEGTGKINGYISLNRRGDNGFGFDEIFELDNGMTLAELSSEEKNKISARSIAIKDLKEKLIKYKKNRR